MTIDLNPGVGAAIGFPPVGYNSHFWLIARGQYEPGTVDGVYVQMDIRTNDPDVKSVANVGADWWRDANARYENGFKNNPGAGVSNWVTLSTRWSTLYFYSMATPKFRSEPPPPLVGAMAGAEPEVAPRHQNSPCRPDVRRRRP
jgi:hypothetical protein